MKINTLQSAMRANIIFFSLSHHFFFLAWDKYDSMQILSIKLFQFGNQFVAASSQLPNNNNCWDESNTHSICRTVFVRQANYGIYLVSSQFRQNSYFGSLINRIAFVRCGGYRWTNLRYSGVSFWLMQTIWKSWANMCSLFLLLCSGKMQIKLNIFFQHNWTVFPFCLDKIELNYLRKLE